jgi:5'-3' exonuclease
LARRKKKKAHRKNELTQVAQAEDFSSLARPGECLLIDGNPLVYDAFYRTKKWRPSDGRNVGGTYGFGRSLIKLLRKFNPTSVAVFFDSPRKNFRHELTRRQPRRQHATDQHLSPDGDWRHAHDPTGKIYYWHVRTRETCWELPGMEETNDKAITQQTGTINNAIVQRLETKSKRQRVIDLQLYPNGDWRHAQDPTGKIYYWHVRTRETCWELPGMERQEALADDMLQRERRLQMRLPDCQEQQQQQQQQHQLHNQPDANSTTTRANSKDARGPSSEYKANRPKAPSGIREQLVLSEELVRAFNLHSIPAMDGYEADDMLATYASLASAKGLPVTIVSPDKDMMQLVCDASKVRLYRPHNGSFVGENGVQRVFGVKPALVPHVQALAGDAVDNIVGLRGISLYTAGLCMREFDGVEAMLQGVHDGSFARKMWMYRRLEEPLAAAAETLRQNLTLCQLVGDVPLPQNNAGGLCPVAQLRRGEHPDTEALVCFLKEQGFDSMLQDDLSFLVGTRPPGQTE